MRAMLVPAIVCAVLLVCAGCDMFGWKRNGGGSSTSGAASTVSRTARADIQARSGSRTTGEAIFTETSGGVTVVVRVKGAPPGPHAVHIHEKGDCSGADAMSAGDHFDPEGTRHHGGPKDEKRHAGDFGNLQVGPDGSGTLELTAKGLTVADGPRSVVGRSIIVHEKPDDFKTQPTGGAGGRIGCGAIQRR